MESTLKNPEPSKTEDSSKAKVIPIEEIESHIGFWNEMHSHMRSLKFKPTGSSSLIISEFHKKNIIEQVQEGTIDDYQYPSFADNDLVRTFIDNFPEIKKIKTSGLSVLPENILFSAGAINGIASCVDLLCKSEDEVVTFDPLYPAHIKKILLRKDLILKTSRMKFNLELNKFEFDFDDFRKCLSPKTRIVMLTNPHNPLSRVFTQEEYAKISEIIADFPYIQVVEDRAYCFYHEDNNIPTPFCIAKAGNFERTITFYSAGKMYNARGLRFGIVVGPRQFIKDSKQFYSVGAHWVSAFEQLVVKRDLVNANKVYGDSASFYEFARKDINRRIEALEKEVKKYHINLVKFEGTYYAVLDISYWRGKIDENYYKNLDTGVLSEELDKAFCRMMMLEKKIGFLPLSCMYYGKDLPDNFVRVSMNINNEDLKYLFDSLEGLLSKQSAIPNLIEKIQEAL